MPSTPASTGGRLDAIWRKRAHRGPMDPLNETTLEAGKGITGDANSGGRRQVTIIERERWDGHMAALGAKLDPSTRRANLMVSGIPLANSRGRVLRVGPTRIRIFGETKPCEQMEEALPGLRRVMYDNWGGGAFGEVIEGGPIAIGDHVAWDDTTTSG